MLKSISLPKCPIVFLKPAQRYTKCRFPPKGRGIGLKRKKRRSQRLRHMVITYAVMQRGNRSLLHEKNITMQLNNDNSLKIV